MSIEDTMEKIVRLENGISSLEHWKSDDEIDKEYYGEFCTPDEIADLKAIVTELERLKAQTEWVAVRSEADLPTQGRRYIWQYRTSSQFIVVQHFEPSNDRAWFVKQYSAYRECPEPYQPVSGNTANGGDTHGLSSID